jgi:hypothetical protein
VATNIGAAGLNYEEVMHVESRSVKQSAALTIVRCFSVAIQASLRGETSFPMAQALLLLVAKAAGHSVKWGWLFMSVIGSDGENFR